MSGDREHTDDGRREILVPVREQMETLVGTGDQRRRDEPDVEDEIRLVVENPGSVSLPTRGWPDHRHAVRSPAHGEKSFHKLLSREDEAPTSRQTASHRSRQRQSRFIDHRSPSRRRLTWAAGGTIMAPGGEHGVTTAKGVWSSYAERGRKR